MNEINLNKGVVSGEITSAPEKYSWNGVEYCRFTISPARASGVRDNINVSIESKLVGDVKTGDFLKLKGCLRSFRRDVEGSRKLLFALQAYQVEQATDSAELNFFQFEGYICHPVVFRTTPAGWKISDVIIAINRDFGPTTYLPCIFWQEWAEAISGAKMGTKLSIQGRLQTRVYTKEIAPGVFEQREAQELSVTRAIVLNEEVV